MDSLGIKKMILREWKIPREMLEIMDDINGGTKQLKSSTHI